MLCRPERKHALLGAAFLLVAARSAEGGVELVCVEGGLQGLRLHHVGIDARPVVEGVHAGVCGFAVGMDDEVEIEPFNGFVAEFYHVAEFPARVDVQERKGQPPRVESLGGDMQHDRAVLADGIEHDRLFGLAHHFPHDVDGLRFEAVEMAERRQVGGHEA